MICYVCPECRKANLRAEPVREDDVCDNCGSKLKKYWSKYGSHKVYIKVLKGFIYFCNKCGEYVTEYTGCSNPWCPEPMEN